MTLLAKIEQLEQEIAELKQQVKEEQPTWEDVTEKIQFHPVCEGRQRVTLRTESGIAAVAELHLKGRYRFGRTHNGGLCVEAES